MEGMARVSVGDLCHGGLLKCLTSGQHESRVDLVTCSGRLGLNGNTKSGRLLITWDQGYGRGVTALFAGVFEPLARVSLYPTDEDGLGTCFGAA